LSIISKVINAFATLGVAATFVAAGVAIGGKATQAENGGAVAEHIIIDEITRQILGNLLPNPDGGINCGHPTTLVDQDVCTVIHDYARGGAIKPLPELEPRGIGEDWEVFKSTSKQAQ
jgi:hypothetical protein